MHRNVRFEQLIDNEFSCYYRADELPRNWSVEFLESEVPEMAAQSAQRFRNTIKVEEVKELIFVLQDLRGDKHHPLLSVISEGSLMEWTDNQENWQVFQRLIGHIIDDLEQVSRKEAD